LRTIHEAQNTLLKLNKFRIFVNVVGNNAAKYSPTPLDSTAEYSTFDWALSVIFLHF